MSEVSLVDGHIDNGMSDEDIIKDLEEMVEYPHYYEEGQTLKSVLDLINRLKAENEKLNIELKAMRGAANSYKAEVERLHNLRKPTETSGFRIENGKVVFYTNMLNGYRHEFKDLDEVVKELNLMLQEAYKTDEIAGYLNALQKRYKKAKAEAIKEFAERLITESTWFDSNYAEWLVSKDDIDNLVKEMTDIKE